MKTEDGLEVFVVPNTNHEMRVVSIFASEEGHFFEDMQILAWRVVLDSDGDECFTEPVCLETECNNERRAIVCGERWRILGDVSGENKESMVQTMKEWADRYIAQEKKRNAAKFRELE